MTSNASYIIYADFNCPFCHALNERLHWLDRDIGVEWRPIQHAPSVRSSDCGYEALCELTEEVKEVRRRAPSTELAVPAFRPNTGLATETIVAASATEPDRVALLRRAIYRAYWIDGLDISHPEVISDLLAATGFADLRVTAAARQRAELWQREWEAGAFDRAIPVTVAANGEPMVGLPAQPSVDGFFGAESSGGAMEIEAVCIMKPRQRLRLMERDPRSIQMILDQLHGYGIDVAEDPSALLDASAVDPVDLVIVDVASVGLEWPSLLARLSEVGEPPPVVVTGPRDTAEVLEATAFAAGAVDFICKPLQPRVLGARLRIHLETQRSREMLSNLARLDPLTEIYNRREFDIHLQLEWDRGLRNNLPVSCLLLDIDHFKEYNDRYGHACGDDCLRRVAQLLRAAVHRPADLLARIGGEEFAVVMAETDAPGADIVAERCRDAIEAARIPHEASSAADRVTVSIGVATLIPARGSQPGSLTDLADRRLYAAKQAGRNRVVTELELPNEDPAGS